MKQILDKIPRPPGAIPARAQTWLLLGLTAAIVATLLLFPGQPERPLRPAWPRCRAQTPPAHRSGCSP